MGHEDFISKRAVFSTFPNLLVRRVYTASRWAGNSWKARGAGRGRHVIITSGLLSSPRPVRSHYLCSWIIGEEMWSERRGRGQKAGHAVHRAIGIRVALQATFKKGLSSASRQPGKLMHGQPRKCTRAGSEARRGKKGKESWLWGGSWQLGLASCELRIANCKRHCIVSTAAQASRAVHKKGVLALKSWYCTITLQKSRAEAQIYPTQRIHLINV